MVRGVDPTDMIVSNVSLGCPGCPGGGGDAGLTRAGATLSPTGHLVVAACLGFIGVFGLVNNLLVLALFCRYRTLRTPINCVLLSLSVSDLLVSVLGTPLSFAASTQGRWLIGRRGCVWYGFINACLGIVSLISLAVLSYERYCTMLAPTIADSSDYGPAISGICFSWFYAVAWTVPPLLGWSSYGPEGPGTTCSVDWSTRTPNNISYILCLFIFCLALPFTIILYSYSKLLSAIQQVGRMSSVVSRRREQKVLVMVVTMVVCYLACWLPYGMVALIATFGPPNLLSPEASIIPSLLAKASTVFNPIIYFFMNKEFYRCFRAFLKCSVPERGSSFKASSPATKTIRATRHRHGNSSAHAPSAAPPTQYPLPDSSVEANQVPSKASLPSHSSPTYLASPRVTLMAYYRE